MESHGRFLFCSVQQESLSALLMPQDHIRHYESSITCSFYELYPKEIV